MKISVIVPIYNAEKYVSACIRSLLSQTFIKSMEVIFIDDGSTDNSGIILDKAVDKHSDFHAFHIQHGGVSHARNIGLEKAKGKYIAFIDADDYIESDYFESLLKETSCELVCGGFTAEYENKHIPHICSQKTEFFGETVIREFLKEDVLSPIVADKLFLREKIGNLRFDESLSMAEDRWFLFEYLKRIKHIQVLPYGKYHYVMNDTSACRNDFDDRKLGSLTVCEKITESVRKLYPSLLPYAECSEMDMKCRVYGEMYYFGVTEQYQEYFKQLKQEIRQFSLVKKFRYSSKKHTAALVAAKISPKLYMFLKNDMKLQYK